MKAWYCERLSKKSSATNFAGLSDALRGIPANDFFPLAVQLTACSNTRKGHQELI